MPGLLQGKEGLSDRAMRVKGLPVDDPLVRRVVEPFIKDTVSPPPTDGERVSRETRGPVSYTHLDVYKRQLRG